MDNINFPLELCVLILLYSVGYILCIFNNLILFTFFVICINVPNIIVL